MQQKGNEYYCMLPCKIWDNVWVVRNYRGKRHAVKGIVTEMHFTNKMKLQIVAKYIGRGEYGKKVFMTRAEAENALHGMSEKEDSMQTV